MVAVTVILSAVIGTSVLDIGSSLSESPPQASFSAEQEYITFDDGQGDKDDLTVVNITHVGGEAIQQKSIGVRVKGTPAYAYSHPSDSQHPIYPNQRSGSISRAEIIKPWDMTIQSDGQVSAGETTRIIAKLSYIIENNQEFGSNWLVYDVYNGDYVYMDGTRRSVAEAGLQQGDTLQVIWTGGGSSSILYEYEVE